MTRDQALQVVRVAMAREVRVDVAPLLSEPGEFEVGVFRLASWEKRSAYSAALDLVDAVSS